MSGLRASVTVHRGGFTLDAAVDVSEGRTVALLGPNGAGKTTLLEALAGLVRLDAGTVSLGDRVLEDEMTFVPPEERQIGVVFQDYLLFGHMSVFQNVAFGLMSRGLERSEVEARTNDWLSRMELTAISEQKARHLSGGQAQKVAVARALATEPELLLLDEPLAALDASTRVNLRRELKEHLAAFRGPRIVITHDPTEAFLLADEIHVLEGGSITQHGSAEDVRMRPRTPYVADLVGVNLLTGQADSGVVDVEGIPIQVADDDVSGSVTVTIHPHSISLHRDQPEGSQRNTWQTTIDRVEHYGSRVRVQTGSPLALAVEITPASERALEIAEGASVWVALKATEVELGPL